MTIAEQINGSQYSPRHQHTPDEIKEKLAIADALREKGMKVPEIAEKLAVTDATYYNWMRKRKLGLGRGGNRRAGLGAAGAAGGGTGTRKSAKAAAKSHKSVGVGVRAKSHHKITPIAAAMPWKAPGTAEDVAVFPADRVTAELIKENRFLRDLMVDALTVLMAREGSAMLAEREDRGVRAGQAGQAGSAGHPGQRENGASKTH